MGDWTGTVPSILAGDVPSGDDFDAMLDELTALSAGWTSYTPAWTSAGVAPALGNGTLTGAYRRVGKTVDARIMLTMGTTTTYGSNQWYLSLPATAAAAWQVGACRVFDTGTANRGATAMIFSTLDKVAMAQNAADVTATTPQTFATGDEVEVHITYEAA